MSERPAPHVWQAAVATCWAIMPERLPAIFEIAAREHLGEGGIEAVAARLGRPLDNTRAVTNRDGIAVIPLEGVIVPRASLFTDISGGVSVDTLALDFTTALNDPAISAIVFAIDSPGGDKNGVAELAGMIYAARDKKPIVAYGRELVASGAYWLAAACERIVVASDALVGSIGVVTAVADPSQRSSRDITFVSSKSPHKRIDPSTEAGAARILARVDAIADLFIGAVATYRGVSVETVEADFGQGDMLIGQAAVAAKLVDEVGSFEGVIAQLQQRAREPRRIGTSGRMAAQGGSMAEQGFWSKFWGNLGAQMDADAAFTPAVAGGVVPVTQTAPNPAPPPMSSHITGSYSPVSQPDPEIERLRAELAQLKDEQRTRAEAEMATRATAFADGLIRDGRALPAEREALIAAHTDAATDDLAHPREGQPSRVARLEEREGARPASGLLGELVPVQPNADGSLTPLANLDKTPFVAGEGEDKPMTLEQRIQIMAMTDLGRAELKRQGIPIPAMPVQQ